MRPIHLRGGWVWQGAGEPSRCDLFLTDRILQQPVARALTIHLEGCTLFPGLVNAHDHLELNHYPRSKFRDRYDNAHQWGEDVNARLDCEPYRGLRSYSLADRLFIGGLKNLLCGATTVAHHNPPHPPLFRRDYPVTALRRYGWAHSLHFQTDAQVRASYRRTPPGVPWFIHLAEGADALAASEYRRLRDLGCAGRNTVLVHGVGLSDADRTEAAQRVRGLVWCPTTNLYLLGQTASAKRWLEAGGRLALGSDSRLTASGDLLDELRAACALGFSPDEVLGLATAGAAALIGLPQAGHLRPGAQADCIALQAEGGAETLCRAHRADLALVVRGGVPQIGDPDIMAQFLIPIVMARLDGQPKAIHARLARQIARCALSEPGLQLEPVYKPSNPL